MRINRITDNKLVMNISSSISNFLNFIAYQKIKNVVIQYIYDKKEENKERFLI